MCQSDPEHTQAEIVYSKSCTKDKASCIHLQVHMNKRTSKSSTLLKESYKALHQTSHIRTLRVTDVGFWMRISTEAVSPQTHSAGPSWGRGRACSSLAANALKMKGLLVPANINSQLSMPAYQLRHAPLATLISDLF